MRRIALCMILLCCCAQALAAGLHFPALTGHVVDDAHILSPQTVAELDRKLQDYENGTTNQVVVVTLSSLQGTSIEDYGYQLGRAWGIGRKGKDNGVLLIVAPAERRVRIEVGYGLEPVLTDAATAEIRTTIIQPAFKAGDMDRGVRDGVDAIVSVLGGKSLPSADAQGYKESPVFGFLILALIFLPFLMVFRNNPLGAMLMLSSMRYGGTSSGGWGGGGFSGGGGSFGGGGSSGSW